MEWQRMCSIVSSNCQSQQRHPHSRKSELRTKKTTAGKKLQDKEFGNKYDRYFPEWIWKNIRKESPKIGDEF